MTLQEVFNVYKPKEGFSILPFQSRITGRFIACVYKKVLVNKYKREYAEGAIKTVSVDTIEKYLKELEPYIEKRLNMSAEVAKFPLTPDEVYQKE